MGPILPADVPARVLGAAGVADAATGDLRRPDAHELFLGSARPWSHARPCHHCSLLIRRDVVGGSADQDTPSLSRAGLYLVHFECDLILAVLQPGAEIFVHRAVLAGAEHDAAVMQPVVDR